MAEREQVWVAADGSWGSYVPGQLWVIDDAGSLEDMSETEIVAFARERGRRLLAPAADGAPVQVVAYISPDAMEESDDVQAVGAGAGDVEWSASTDDGADVTVILRLAPPSDDDEG